MRPFSKINAESGAGARPVPSIRVKFVSTVVRRLCHGQRRQTEERGDDTDY